MELITFNNLALPNYLIRSEEQSNERVVLLSLISIISIISVGNTHPYLIDIEKLRIEFYLYIYLYKYILINRPLCEHHHACPNLIEIIEIIEMTNKPIPVFS